MMIKAQIVGRREAEAAGVRVNASAPVLALCRKLLAMGFDPKTPLEAYRGETLCLRVRSIGEGAKLEVSETGAPRFEKARDRSALASNTGFEEEVA